MKKLSILVIAIIFSIQLNAQSKVGTIDVEYILSTMPQIEQVRVDVKLYNDKINDVTRAIFKEHGDARARVCKKTGDEI